MTGRKMNLNSNPNQSDLIALIRGCNDNAALDHSWTSRLFDALIREWKFAQKAQEAHYVDDF